MRFAGEFLYDNLMIQSNRRYVKERYDLRGTAFVDRCGFHCGNYPDLSESDIDVICSCLFKVLP